VAVISYQDKFGPLGKIAVLQGQREQDSLTLHTWVMSCRAFSRRIEYQCLQALFESFQLARIHLQFEPTSKNGPTQEFLSNVTGSAPAGPVTIEQNRFREIRPQLFHRVTIQGL
jgi:predicted enzyme involved in methoxymalonyl-ACP biosynthesis